MQYSVRLYEENDWHQLSRLIDEQWGRNHVIRHKPLFDWQFGGFGGLDNKIRSLVLYDGDRLIGFRGIIPGLYQVPLPEKKMRIINGGSFSMWIVHSDYRGKKLGLKLHLAAQELLPVITGAGSTYNTSVPIYLKNDFRMLGSMHRYVIPLIAEGYRELLVSKVPLKDVMSWKNSCDKSNNAIFPEVIDLKALERLWMDVTFTMHLFSIYKTEAFWRWRYRDNVGFDYLMFGDPEGSGVVVARIETVDAEDSEPPHGLSVFRIIEIIPGNTHVWSYEGDKDVESLLSGILKWAQNQGCVAADFYCSHTRFGGVLLNLGFRNQTDLNNNAQGGYNVSLAMCGLVPLFSPFRLEAEPINALYRIHIADYGFIRPDFEEIHMVKSENDMDRPNKMK